MSDNGKNAQPILIDRITQRDAAHVLYVMGMEGGIEPGGFVGKLVEAMIVADTTNQHRLRAAFTGLQSAVDVYQRMNGGVAVLQQIADGRPYDPAER